MAWAYKGRCYHSRRCCLPVFNLILRTIQPSQQKSSNKGPRPYSK